MLKRLFLSSIIAAIAFSAFAQAYKVAIVQVSTSESFKALVEAIGAATGAKFEIQVVPSARVAYLVENGQADLGLPLLGLRDPAKAAALAYDYASASIYKNAFVLYSSKSKPLDIAELKKGNPKGYKIESGGSNANQYEFTATLSPNVEGSLRKIDSGSIDGYIYSQISSDVVLKATGLKSVRRQLYSDYDLRFILRKGGKGGALDALLSEGMAKIKASGRFDAIMGDIVKAAKYSDWQP
jgi:polar amino acid transport system substrate-binding protein